MSSRTEVKGRARDWENTRCVGEEWSLKRLQLGVVGRQMAAERDLMAPGEGHGRNLSVTPGDHDSL